MHGYIMHAFFQHRHAIFRVRIMHGGALCTEKDGIELFHIPYILAYKQNVKP